MKKIIIVVTALLALAFPVPVFSTDEDNAMEFHGYYKILQNSSRSMYTDEEIFSDTNRLRLEFNKRMNPWQFYITLDNEAIVNDFEHTADFDMIRSMQQKNTASLDLDKVSVDSDHLYLRHSIYRAYIKYYQPEFQATVGKQAVDWGKLRFYSPLDVFNPVGPLALEPDERIGVDAVNINWAPESFAGINAVAAPGENDEKSGGGVRVYKKISTYDLALIVSSMRKNETYGVSFDGYIKSAGFRGEIAHVNQDNKRQFPRVGLGVDYTFTEKFYGLIEQFYNGGSENDTANFYSSYLSAREIMSVEHNLTSTWLKYAVTPLLNFNNYVLYDWDGKSVAFNPEFVYNIRQNADLRVGSQFYWGNANTEFGEYQNTYYAEFKWFF